MNKRVFTAQIFGGILIAFGIFQAALAILRGPSTTAFPRLDRYIPYVGALLNIVLGIIFLKKERV